MNLVLTLSTLAMRNLVDSACKAAGVSDVKETALRAVKVLNEHFTDHSQRLTTALRNANERAWKALELSLAGETFWERCTTRTEDKAFAQQVRSFLDAAKLPEAFGEPTFRQQCLQELRIARKADLLTTGALHPQELAEQTTTFARFSDPQSLFDAEGRIIEGMARELKEAGYGNLAMLMTQQPSDGRPLLVIAARYFFRRSVEEDAKLFQGLAFAQLERLGKKQEEGFASLHTLMSQQGEQLEGMLADVHAVIIETHSAVLDLQGQIKGLSGQTQEIVVAVQKLLEQHQLHRREVRLGDSVSIRNENEVQLVKQVVARYRALPESERRQAPALLNSIGKLEVAAGDFDAACYDFAAVATLVEDNKVRAEAYFNSYQTCLERRDWPSAIQEFIKAVKLDPQHFASFPIDKYQPQSILGAGGFGVAFLCKHRYMEAQVVVKALMLEDLGRDADKVFMEAQVLRRLDHPAIIRIADCGYVDATKQSRPFLVMDYFEGETLEEYVKKHGSLAVEDLLAVARSVAEGLQAAHSNSILHRDVKPANLLVRRDGGSWQAKVIDFGLAMAQKVVKTSMNASTAKRNKTRMGGSIAGTLDYAAPEQMGKRDDAVGPYSDIYGWGKTCCYALFQTAQPLLKHWHSIPPGLAELLGACLEEDPKKRPPSFAHIMERLNLLIDPVTKETLEVVVLTPTRSPKPPIKKTPVQSQATGLTSTVLEAVAAETENELELRYKPDHDSRQVEQAKNTLRKPAIALVVAGCLGLGADLFLAGFAFIDEFITPLTGTSKERESMTEPVTRTWIEKTVSTTPIAAGKDHDQASIVITIFMWLFCSAASGISIWAGFDMKNLRNYRFSIIGSCAVMPGACFCCLIGVPIGVWSLIVLAKPEVYSAFR